MDARECAYGSHLRVTASDAIRLQQSELFPAVANSQHAGYIQRHISLLADARTLAGTEMPPDGARKTQSPEGLRRHPGHLRVRRRPLPRGLSSQHVLHVAD